MHSSNIYSVYVPKENKIDRGIIENSSVQTTTNNHDKSLKSPFFENSAKLGFLRFFEYNTPMHSSNICYVYVPKENKIHRGINENSSVQTTTNYHAKSPKSPFFKNQPKFQSSRFFKNNTPMHSSNIFSVYMLKENKIH